MGRIQLSILLTGVVTFVLMAMSNGEAAYTVQAFMPGWVPL